jgi:ethanolamine utilization protein EutP (predicted NTPase)
LTGAPASPPSAEFAAFKDSLTELAVLLRRLAEPRGDARALELVENVASRLASNRFQLAVLGQFKRGKTTFLNSLLGAEVLPVAVIPVTCVVTALSYGERPEAEVHFLNHEVRPIPLGELAAYVTEQGNPENRRNVKHVEVRYPSPYLRDGVRLLDTPGVGSVHRHNTDAAHALLAEADAGVFVFSADPPLTQLEADFLVQARDHVHRFFFVLNKTDLMEAEDLREALDFTWRQLRALLGPRPGDLFPLSAREALRAKVAGDRQRLERSGLAAFETALDQFLMKDKGRVLLASALADLLRVAANLRFQGELEQQARALPLEQLEEKRRLLERDLAGIEAERADMNVLLRNDVARCLARVEADLREHVEAALTGSLERLEASFAAHNWKGRNEFGRRFDAFMAAETARVFQEWRRREDRRMDEVLRDLAQRFTERTNAILARIRDAAAGLFAVRLELVDGPSALGASARFSYHTDPLFYFTLDKIPFLLPGPLFRRHAMKRMRAQVREELEKNAGRIRHDYLERIERNLEAFRRALNGRIDSLVEAIHRALARAAEARRESERALAMGARQYEEERRLLARIEQTARTVASRLNLGEGNSYVSP